MISHSELKDFLLMRCFDCKKYLDELINGDCLHMNSVKRFREESNKFQGDPNDCAVIVNNEILSGALYAGNGIPEKRLFEANLNEFALNGYLYCFFALPKEFFKIENNTLMYDAESPYCEKFFHCLHEYRKNCKSKSCYVGLFDAVALVNRLEQCLEKLNLSYSCGFVEYKKLNSKERMKLLAENHPDRIVLTKDPSYSYQSEFRFFVRTREKIDEYLQIYGLDLSDILAMQFEFNPHDWEVTPDEV